MMSDGRLDGGSDRADEGHAPNLVGPLADDGARQVAAVGLTDHEERLSADLFVHEIEQGGENVVGTAGRRGSTRASHAGQIGIEPPVAGTPAEDGFETSGHEPVVRRPAV
jgi:hypothetical protein